MKAVEWSGKIRKDANGRKGFYHNYRKDYDAYMQTLEEGDYIFLGFVKDKDLAHDPDKMKAYFARLRWLAEQLAHTGNTAIDIDQMLMEQLGFFTKKKDLRGHDKIKHWSHKILSNDQWMAMINAQEQLALEENLGSIPGKKEPGPDQEPPLFPTQEKTSRTSESWTGTTGRTSYGNIKNL